MANARVLAALLMSAALAACSAAGSPNALTAKPSIVPAMTPAEATSAEAVTPQASAPQTIALQATESAGVRTQAVVPGRPSRVFILAALGDACEPLLVTDLKLATPPAKGAVTFTPGQRTKIAASGTGKCLGATATGTGIYYTARPGETGTDQFSVAAVLPSGETASRSFTVEIAR